MEHLYDIELDPGLNWNEYHALQFSRDGKYAACVTSYLSYAPDVPIKVFRIDGNVVSRVNLPYPLLFGDGGSDYLNWCAFSPDSKLLATGDSGEQFYIWEIIDGEFVPFKFENWPGPYWVEDNDVPCINYMLDYQRFYFTEDSQQIVFFGKQDGDANYGIDPIESSSITYDIDRVNKTIHYCCHSPWEILGQIIAYECTVFFINSDASRIFFGSDVGFWITNKDGSYTAFVESLFTRNPRNQESTFYINHDENYVLIPSDNAGLVKFDMNTYQQSSVDIGTDADNSLGQTTDNKYMVHSSYWDGLGVELYQIVNSQLTLLETFLEEDYTNKTIGSDYVYISGVAISPDYSLILVSFKEGFMSVISTGMFKEAEWAYSDFTGRYVAKIPGSLIKGDVADIPICCKINLKSGDDAVSLKNSLLKNGSVSANIIVTDYDGNELPFECFIGPVADKTQKDVTLYVRVPQLTGGTDFTLVMYFNNVEINSVSYTSADVWLPGYDLVQHNTNTSVQHTKDL